MAVLCVGLVMACYFDYKKSRIPNWLIVCLLLTGISGKLLREGMTEGVFFCGRCLCIMFLLYPLFKIGGLGAGDIKLYGVCAGYLSRHRFLYFFFVSLLIAAIFSFIKLIKESNMTERMTYLCQYIGDVVKTGAFGLYMENAREQKRCGICMAGPILLSVFLYMGGIY